MEKIQKIILKPLLRRVGTALAAWIVVHLDADAETSKQILEVILAVMALLADLTVSEANRRLIIAEKEGVR